MADYRKPIRICIIIDNMPKDGVLPSIILLMMMYFGAIHLILSTYVYKRKGVKLEPFTTKGVLSSKRK